MAYQNAQVRDLVWVMSAPNLLVDADWLVTDKECQVWLDAATPQLRALDANPDALHSWIAKYKPVRLGRYFEVLVHYWIAHLMPATWYVTNQIVKSERIVLGEYDLLWRDAAGALQHWEIAVKFYLQIDVNAGFAGYVGTMLRDRLDLKVSHLRDKQLRLSSTSAGAASLPVVGEPVRARVLLKSWLFYPAGVTPQFASGLSHQHLHGWWGRWGELDLADDMYWQILPRLAWLSPVLTLDASILRCKPDFVVHLTAYFNQSQVPVLVAGLSCIEDVWHEQTRGFITPLGWPDLTNCIDVT
jgi:hypothetical protein